MKPLFHPSADDITVEGILHALADPTRVAIYAQIVAANRAQTCASFLQTGDRIIPKSTLSLHFKARREAGLIRCERQGTELRNTSHCGEIELRFPGLIPAIISAAQRQLSATELGARGAGLGARGKRGPAARTAPAPRRVRA